MINEALSKGLPLDIIYADFAKFYGFRLKLIDWIKLFLTGRFQRVILGDSCSDWVEVDSGAPLGSVLGPILFVIFINDMLEIIINSCEAYADDTKIRSIIKNFNSIFELQSDKDRICKWCKYWPAQLKVEKCRVVHLGLNNIEFDYEMFSQKLNKSKCEKDLGIYIQNDLKWHTQLKNVTAKGNRMLGIIIKSFKNPTAEIIKLLYCSLVRPHLEYAVSSCFETTSKIQVLTETTSTFPTVTICNANFFTSEYSAQLFKNFTQNISTISNYFHYNIGDSFDKLIINCQFLTFNCKNEKYWNYFYHRLYGNCYQFISKSENLIRISRTGWESALNIILNISVANGLDGLLTSIGAYVMIHNQTISPLSADAFSVSPGIETNIGLSRQFKSLKPKPYSNCDGDTSNPNNFNTKLFNLIHSKNIGYNQKLCIDLCFQDLNIQECKCYFGGYPFIGSESISLCQSDSEIRCTESNIENYFTDSNIINNVCLKQCPLECNGMKFSKFYSFNEFINEQNNEDLNDFFNFTGTNRRQMKKDFASLNIYYETLNYEEITEKESIEFVDLLSNIGGIAGLFLGISFLSLVEIIEIGFQITNLLIQPKANQVKDIL
ncbi:unnamed protein product [Brachionus calyciflorus]|uniref:Reverse transcriptase domain-containing protein n=1 Tax=Brachionus calyciflorus TaxID=104777 RepID=A0A813QK13_9BILA|nr:unnamed protein product [Brachionus calyciflorus]